MFCNELDVLQLRLKDLDSVLEGGGRGGGPDDEPAEDLDLALRGSELAVKDAVELNELLKGLLDVFDLLRVSQRQFGESVEYDDVGDSDERRVVLEEVWAVVCLRAARIDPRVEWFEGKEAATGESSTFRRARPACDPETIYSAKAFIA